MSAVLERNDQIQTPSIETYADLQPQRYGVPREIPIFEIEVNGIPRKLTRPITLRVSFEDGTFVVENETLALFGAAESLRGAVGEFLEDVAYYWDYYKSLSPTSVAGRGVYLKQLYESLVR